MKKKVLAAMLMVSMGVGMLAGCGDAKSDNSDTQEVKEEKKADDGDETAVKEEEKSEPADVYVFIAASLKNTMEEIKTAYEKEHENINIIYNADSSGTLQKQIEEGAQCDVFFSAATKQMEALKEGGLVEEGSVKNLLENKIVLIKPKGGETKVTGFENITDASSLALAGEDVPVGQYARQLFTNLGNLDQVMAMEINEGANVTAVLTAVAEGSNEVGVVYKTDAAPMPEDVEIICEAAADQVEPAAYPVGLVKDEQADDAETAAAKEFLKYLTTDASVMASFEKAGFTPYTE
jgi:molybdate transport system substrate-binding protein